MLNLPLWEGVFFLDDHLGQWLNEELRRIQAQTSLATILVFSGPNAQLHDCLGLCASKGCTSSIGMGLDEISAFSLARLVV